jgi:2-polyprenyl-3-methyl-5-hydroxy-6-metoxy-1,4-benzoquinol methylase
MNQGRKSRHTEDDPERFYRSFWRSRHWGAIEPNADERARLAAIEELLEDCALPEKPRILDLGCGRGWLSRELAKYGEVLGTDVVAAAVERARELFPNLSFRHGDLRDLLDSPGRESFDLVVSSEVIEHVADADKPGFLGGIYQLLKPAGHAILTTPRGELRELWRSANQADQPVEEWISETELDALATASGLRVERRTRAWVYGITFRSRLFASRPFRAAARGLPSLERLTYASRIYQIVLLQRPADS